jgi:transposase InsO family protein
MYGLINGGYTVRKNLSLEFILPAVNLSRSAKQRLKWLDFYKAHGKNASLTCRYFGISRKTFYKWLKRFNTRYLQSLEDKTRKPHKYRTSRLFFEYGGLIKQIRTEHPTWSKYKIGAVIRQNGGKISDGSIGNILKKRGLIDRRITKKRKRARMRNINKIRIKNAEIDILQPGDLMQMDTKEVNVPGAGKYIQFTAIDCFSRKRVLKGYGRKTAFCGKDFLLAVIKELPFQIKAILTDNGSEFMAEFDEACKAQNITHYWTDADSPNQNAFVESSHCIDQKEFYEIQFIPVGLANFNNVLREWQHVYNYVRPHGSLKFLSPDKFLESVKMTAT